MRAVFIVVALVIIVLIGYLCSNFYFGLVTFNQVVVSLATLYTRFRSISLIPHHLILLLSLYLQSQGLVFTVLVIDVAMLGTGLTALFSLSYGLGFIGIPVGYCMVEYLNLFVISIVVVVHHLRVNGGSLGDFFNFSAIFTWTGIKDYLWIAIPTAVVFFVDEIAIQLVAPITGRFVGDFALQAIGIVIVCVSILTIVQTSISVTVTIRTGTHIGEGSVYLAKQALVIGLALTLLVSAINSLLLFTGQFTIFKLFTVDAKILEFLVLSARFSALFLLMHGLKMVAIGALRAMKKQNLILILTLFVQYPTIM